MYGEFPVSQMLDELEVDNLLPCILFRTSRRQCDNDIERLGRDRNLRIPYTRQDLLKKEIKQVIAKYDVAEEIITTHPHYQALISSACGAHHAGQLVMWRLLLEELMSKGMLRLMIATGTVAAGVDFPARTVIITAHSKRGAEGFRISTAAEFQQMSGRAGRRGKDAVGFCLIAPSPFSDARLIHEVAKKPPEPLRSAYFASPSTVLNLLKFRNVDDLHFTVSRSLASFLDRKNSKIIEADAQKMEQELPQKKLEMNENQFKKYKKRINRRYKEAESLRSAQETLLNKTLDGLRTLKYLDGGNLTEKGYWAANLCTTYVLELAEAINDKVFEGLSLLEFVGLVASISADSHRTYLRIKRNPIKAEDFQKLDEIAERVRLAYERPPLVQGMEVVPDAALSMVMWMEAQDWSEFMSFVRLSGVAEGDIARLIGQTAEHLNQISRLFETHKELALMAEEGRRKILRPPFVEGVTVEV